MPYQSILGFHCMGCEYFITRDDGIALHAVRRNPEDRVEGPWFTTWFQCRVCGAQYASDGHKAIPVGRSRP